MVSLTCIVAIAITNGITVSAIFRTSFLSASDLTNGFSLLPPHSISCTSVAAMVSFDPASSSVMVSFDAEAFPVIELVLSLCFILKGTVVLFECGESLR